MWHGCKQLPVRPEVYAVPGGWGSNGRTDLEGEEDWPDEEYEESETGNT
jgi:hypothetical protein